MSLLVAVLSDTHIPSHIIGLPPRVLPREIFPCLEKADLILHAGDIVKATLLDELAAYAPVRAVRGNWDTESSVIDLPETLELEIGSVTVAMIHNSGLRKGKRKRLLRRFPEARVIIFGHSHTPGIEDEDGLMFLNPGGGSTLALLHIEEGDVYGEIVDLNNGAHNSIGYYPPLSLEPPKRPKGADFTATTRRLLLEKAVHKCQICSSGELPEIAHVVPVSEGGRGTPENGQVLCRPCRVEKNNKDHRRRELNEYLETV